MLNHLRNVSGLTVLNSRTNATIVYPLTGGTADPLEHGTVINLVMPRETLTSLK